MSRTTKRICLYVAIFLMLEIGLVIGWNQLRGREAALRDNMAETLPEIADTTTETTLPEYTVAEETTAPETMPEESTTPETMPEETTAPETMPEETAEPEALSEETTAPVTEPEETVKSETQPQENPEPEAPPANTEYVELSDGRIPRYYQNDYPDSRYETNDIARSGSGITALAMVASYMTDHNYYPDELADYVAHHLGNHYERLEFGSDLLRLSWKRGRNIHEVLQAVKDGKVAIVLFNNKSPFTYSYHYIVLTGVNEDGLITLLDPDKTHYSRVGMDVYLRDGIKEGYLFAGYEGGWIYDKSAMPEETYLYTPEPFAEECRYPGLELTEAELDLLADLIWLEGRSEPFEGQQAIAEVVLNRMVSGKFGSSISNIIHAPNQFPSISQRDRAKPTYTQYKAIERAMYGPYVVPLDVMFYARFAVNKNVWGKIGAHTFCYGK